MRQQRPPTPPNENDNLINEDVWPQDQDQEEDGEEERGEEEKRDEKRSQEQEGGSSWNTRISRMFPGGTQQGFAQEMADITFRVQLESDLDNEVQFKAHKFILALRSPVFKAMFFGPVAERSSEILVPDVTPTAFKAMLTYIYRDDVRLQTLQGAWQLWYAARKYMIDSLEERCRKHLKTHLTPWNVLDTYAFAENYGDTQVQYQCLRLIDKNAGYILASPGFASLPVHLVKSLVSRGTLNVREVDVFEAIIRWCQTEIKRRLDDAEEGEVPSLSELFVEFQPLIKFGAFTSQEFVHHVLPYNVLGIDAIGQLSAKIRHKEEPETFRDSSSTPTLSSPEPRQGLNQARDLLLLQESSSSALTSSPDSIRQGNVHAVESPDRRPGPGYYQCTRFSPKHEFLVAKTWPEEYRLKFLADRSVYLLGACVTETDRQFYSPKLKYLLVLKDLDGNTLSEGSETFIKKTSNRLEGGFPKPLDYGPHDITFKNVAHVYGGKWYQLCLLIRNVSTSFKGPPLLVCKCKNSLTAFGTTFEFEPSVSFEDEAEESGNGGGQRSEDSEQGFAVLQESTPQQHELAHGLISRLYFYH